MKKQRITSKSTKKHPRVGNLGLPRPERSTGPNRKKPNCEAKPQKASYGAGAPILYCGYHKINGHSTEDCRMFKAEVARVLEQGPVYDDAMEPSRQRETEAAIPL